MKGLRVTKIVRQIKFEGALNELETKNCLQRQSWAGCLRRALVFMWGGEPQGGGSGQFFFVGVSWFLVVLTEFSV